MTKEYQVGKETGIIIRFDDTKNATRNQKNRIRYAIEIEGARGVLSKKYYRKEYPEEGEYAGSILIYFTPQEAHADKIIKIVAHNDEQELVKEMKVVNTVDIVIKTIKIHKNGHPQLSVDCINANKEISYYTFGLKNKYNDLNLLEMDVRTYDTGTNKWLEANPTSYNLRSEYSTFNSKITNEGVDYDSFVTELFNQNDDDIVIFKHTDNGNFSDDKGNILNCGDELPEWKKFLQAYNDWIFKNFTTKTPNWMPQTPFDARGYELYFHWVNGTGRKLLYNEGLWGDYMRDNAYIKYHLIEIGYYEALEMKSKGKKNIQKGSEGDIHFELENGYFTGYEMLHGTNHFNVLSTEGVYNDKDNYVFTFKISWKDKINPNKQQGDTETAKIMKQMNLNMAKDYDIEIIWTQQVIIKTDGSQKIVQPDEVTEEARNRRRR